MDKKYPYYLSFTLKNVSVCVTMFPARVLIALIDAECSCFRFLSTGHLYHHPYRTQVITKAAIEFSQNIFFWIISYRVTNGNFKMPLKS